MIQCPTCKSLFQTEAFPLCCPSCKKVIEEKDGITCFPIPCSDEYFFPKDGFSLLYQNEYEYFWFRSRNEIIGKFISQSLPGTQFSDEDRERIRHRELQLCEVGCGTGLVSLYLTQKGYRMTCCDLFMEGLSFAMERNYGECFYRCNIYDLPFYDEFEAIFACDVLEHLDDDLLALKRLNQALKPGGICLITVPADMALWSDVDIHAGHKRRYNIQELSQKLIKEGLNPIRMSYFMTVPYPLLWIKRCLRTYLNQTRHTQIIKETSPNELNIPKILNELLYVMLWPERKIIQYLNLPFGSSLICIAQKPYIE